MSQALLNDLYHWCSTDLQAGNTGDLMAVTGTTRGQQRILRRLLTNPGDYIFQPDYGAGLPKYVGELQTKAVLDRVGAIVRAQIAKEAIVARKPAPEISITQTSDFALLVYIKYVDAPSNRPVVLGFTVAH